MARDGDISNAFGGFWNGRRVLVTGHTGFKGAWLCLWLERLGARVSGLALAPSSEPSLYALAGPWQTGDEAIVDLRDASAVRDLVARETPEIVFHMAAQALVRPSYREPLETFASNVMGTAHLLDAVRTSSGVRAVVAITTDKVYENHGEGRPFAEGDRLGGKDPYSSSKACAELVAQSYRDSFFSGGQGPAVATARAGNVVGGGDWSEDRLIPDAVRALSAGRRLQLRHPDAVRPWQHVLEPLRGYLMLAERLATSSTDAPKALNFGPDPGSFLTVAQVIDALAEAFGSDLAWEPQPGNHPPEAATLTLDSRAAREALGWQPLLSMQETVAWTAAWYRDWRAGAAAREITLEQIARYEERGLKAASERA